MVFKLKIRVKTFFNRYKYKRKLGRVARQVINRKDPSRDPSLRSSRDFAWGGGARNPYRLPEEEKSGRYGLKFFLLFFFCLAWIGFIFLHPFFHIRKMTVEGLHRIKQSELEQKIQDIMGKPYIGPVSRRNFFLVPEKQIRAVLTSVYPIQSITINKTFPHGIHFTVQEKTSAILYSNAETYVYMDIDGNIVEKIDHTPFLWATSAMTTSTVTSTSDVVSTVDFSILNTAARTLEEKKNDLPIVYDANEIDKTQRTAQASASIIKGVVAWENFLKNNLEIPVRYYVVQNEVGDGMIMTTQGWYIIANFNKDVERQFRNVATVLDTSIKQSQVQYMNVRFNDRVYWQ